MTPEEFGKILAEHAYFFRLGLTAPPIWGRVGRAYSKRMREGAQK